MVCVGYLQPSLLTQKVPLISVFSLLIYTIYSSYYLGKGYFVPTLPPFGFLESISLNSWYRDTGIYGLKRATCYSAKAKLRLVFLRTILLSVYCWYYYAESKARWENVQMIDERYSWDDEDDRPEILPKGKLAQGTTGAPDYTTGVPIYNPSPEHVALMARLGEESRAKLRADVVAMHTPEDLLIYDANVHLLGDYSEELQQLISVDLLVRHVKAVAAKNAPKPRKASAIAWDNYVKVCLARKALIQEAEAEVKCVNANGKRDMADFKLQCDTYVDKAIEARKLAMLQWDAHVNQAIAGRKHAVADRKAHWDAQLAQAREVLAEVLRANPLPVAPHLAGNQS